MNRDDREQLTNKRSVLHVNPKSVHILTHRRIYFISMGRTGRRAIQRFGAGFRGWVLHFQKKMTVDHLYAPSIV